MDEKKYTIKKCGRTFTVQKVSPAVKVESDEQGREFITDPDTGKRFYESGTVKNLEDALASVIENRKEQFPEANFPQGNA